MKTYKIILPNGKTIKYNAEYFSKADKGLDFYFFISKNNVGVAPDGSAVFELDCQNTNSINIRERYNDDI